MLFIKQQTYTVGTWKNVVLSRQIKFTAFCVTWVSDCHNMAYSKTADGKAASKYEEYL